VLFLLAVLFTVHVYQEWQARQRVNDKLNQLRKFVQVGDDLDQTVQVLKKKGFRVSETYKPTNTGDYYIVLIRLRQELIWGESIEYALGIGAEDSVARYAVIKADLDGQIASPKK